MTPFECSSEDNWGHLLTRANRLIDFGIDKPERIAVRNIRKSIPKKLDIETDVSIIG